MWQPLAIAALALQPEGTPPPNFEFRGIVAGAIVDTKAAGFKRSECKDDGPSTITCTRLFDEIATVPALAMHTFYSGRLGVLSFTFDNGEVLRVAEALAARYGKACRQEESLWRNRAGASLPNTTFVWCFATGSMKLRLIASRINSADLIYTDNKVLAEFAPKSGPKIDF